MSDAFDDEDEITDEDPDAEDEGNESDEEQDSKEEDELADVPSDEVTPPPEIPLHARGPGGVDLRKVYPNSSF